MVSMYEKERERLIESLIRCGYLTKKPVIDAFRKVPRHEFIPENIREYAYSDHPQPISDGQTISAPSMIAIMLEYLDLALGQRVLEIGAGSGYNAALAAEIVGPRGEVVTIERIPRLAEFAEKNLKKAGFGRVTVVVGDGSLGYEKGAPWDRILMTACAPEVPEPLVKQLKAGGKLGAPVGKHYMFQTWTVVEKTSDKEVRTTEHGGCSFVPLVGKLGWRE